MNPTKILVVEDEFILANDIAERLANLGYKVVGTAISGLEAIELAGSLQPDLVLMDIRLKGPLDGITAGTKIRQTLHLPVIFLTAYADDDTLQRAKAAEPFGYILKPFEDRELRTSIEIAIYKHRAEAEIRRLTRLYAVLSQVSQAIVRFRAEKELFPRVCEIAVEFGQLTNAWIAMLDDASGALVPAAKAGNDAGIVVIGKGIDHCSCINAVLRDGRACVINHLAPELTRSHKCQEMADKVGLRSCAAYPLRVQDRLCGVFVVGTAEKEFFNPAETHLLEEIALDLSGGLATIRAERLRQAAETALQHREEHLRTILETALDGFWVVDTQGKLLEVNNAYCEMSGYPREELLKMRISDLESLETEQEAATHIQRVTRQGADRFETRHRRKDGKAIDVEFSVNFQDFEGGRFICFVRDITKRKQDELALLRSEAKFRSYIKDAPSAIFVADRDGRFVDCNPAAVDLLGCE